MPVGLGESSLTPEDPAWRKIPPMTLPLSGQIITRPVWPEPTARALTVRSMHNGTDIAFLLEWQDNTRNDRLTPGTFRDGVAWGCRWVMPRPFFVWGNWITISTFGTGRLIGKATSIVALRRTTEKKRGLVNPGGLR